MVFEHLRNLFDLKDLANNFHNFSRWTPMLLQVLSQGPLFKLLVLLGFWFWLNLIEAFDPLLCME
jgi:hypothetical protein